MKNLTGKLQTWSLSENPKEGRRFINTTVNFGVLRRYFLVDVYNPETDSGEQRQEKDRHINKLRSEISNFNYTPESFNATVPDMTMVNVDDKGNISIPISEAQKMILLNGGCRLRALMELWNENEKTARMVDDLPIPLIVQLDNDHRKKDFLNLNAGMRVSKSLIELLNISTGRMGEDKLLVSKRMVDLVKKMNSNNSSPLHNKVNFGHIHNNNLLQFTQLGTTHKATLIASFFGTAKLLKAMEKDDDWYVQLFIDLNKFIVENTDYTKAGKLLALPPDGAKGNVANWISIVNTTAYYLYLREEMNQNFNLEDNKNHIISCIKVYDGLVAGDVSRKRRQLTSQAFAQKLFADMEIDDSCPVGFHCGIPISLFALTSYSSFSVDPPESNRSSKPENEVVETTSETKIPSDTDPAWEDE